MLRRLTGQLWPRLKGLARYDSALRESYSVQNKRNVGKRHELIVAQLQYELFDKIIGPVISSQPVTLLSGVCQPIMQQDDSGPFLANLLQIFSAARF
jgi:hypothetical protein